MNVNGDIAYLVFYSFNGTEDFGNATYNGTILNTSVVVVVANDIVVVEGLHWNR